MAATGKEPEGVAERADMEQSWGRPLGGGKQGREGTREQREEAETGQGPREPQGGDEGV